MERIIISLKENADIKTNFTLAQPFLFCSIVPPVIFKYLFSFQKGDKPIGLPSGGFCRKDWGRMEVWPYGAEPML